MERDRGASRSFYYLCFIPANEWKSFGPPIMETDWYALVGIMSKAPTLEEV